MLDKYSVYNVLAEGMYFFEKVAHKFSTLRIVYCFSEVVQILCAIVPRCCMEAWMSIFSTPRLCVRFDAFDMTSSHVRMKM